MARQSTRPPLETIQAELTDPDYKVRKEAIKQLMRHYRQQAYQPLLELLKDGRGDVRAKAVQALAKLKDPRAFLPVLGQLSDKNASVRAQVARALGEFGDPSAVPLLVDLLNSSQPRVCACAARSLGKLRTASSLPVLIAYLERARKAGDETELYHAARALGDFGAPAVVEPLLALCERSSSSSVHWIVVDALSRAGEQVRPLLAQILIDQGRPSGVRICVAQAVDRKPCPEYLPSLLIALTDSHLVIREEAAKALARIQDPCTIEPLTRLLDDPDPGVLIAAIKALSAQHATSVVDRLINLLSYHSSSDIDSHRVVYNAIQALRELGDPRAVKPLLDAFWRLDRHSLVVEIASALRQLNDPSIIEALLEHFSAATGIRRIQILALLEHFQDARSVEPLLAQLDLQTTSWSEIRFQTRLVRLLGKLGDPHAIEPLRAGLLHTSGDLHSALQDILAQLDAQVPC